MDASIYGIIILLVILVLYCCKCMKIESMVTNIGGIGESAHLKNFMKKGTYLNVGEYISGGNMFMIQQADGNLCIYRGTSPNNSGSKLWCSGVNIGSSTGNTQFITIYEGDKLITYVVNSSGTKTVYWAQGFPIGTTIIAATENGPVKVM
jgi:hypothetical protein